MAKFTVRLKKVFGRRGKKKQQLLSILPVNPIHTPEPDEPESDQLCSYCEQLQYLLLSRDWKSSIERNQMMIQGLAPQKTHQIDVSCALCRLLTQQMRSSRVLSSELMKRPLTGYFILNLTDNGSVLPGEENPFGCLYFFFSDPFQGLELLWFFGMNGQEEKPQAAFENRLIRYRHPTRQEKFTLIQEWFAECTKDTRKFFPRRILDLAAYSNNTRGPLRLIDAHEEEVRGPYVALSHRWGLLGGMFRTTIENIQIRKAGITFEELPRTFQDAVITTRLLGIRYLWIDALCIIQQDADDWLVESKIMGALYENAVCTISAHCAGNEHEGFLESTFCDPPTIKLPSLRDGRNTYSRYVTVPGDFVYDVDESPLSGRGWILQERVCSRRILHFTRSQIFWEDEHGYKGQKGSILPQQSRLRKSPEITIPRLAYPNITINDWYTLVERYSACSLTIPTDKFPAMSGIARLIAPRIQEGRYFCGIWLRQVHYGLLWRNSSKHDLQIPIKGRAPTWSWAHYDGQIDYPYGVNTLHSEISCRRAIALAPKSVDDDAWIEGLGELIISARLKPLNTFILRKLGSTNDDALFSAQRRFLDLKERSEWLMTGSSIVLDRDDGQVERVENASLLYLAYIGSSASFHAVLVLLKTKDSPPTYIRLGMGQIHGDLRRCFDGVPHTIIHLV